MGFFNKFLKKNAVDSNAVVASEIVLPELKKVVEQINIDLPEGEIVKFEDGVLDTSSSLAVQIFKHNLQVLIEEAKRKGKIDNFKLIREDDYFPKDYEWQVASKNTCMERNCLGLSIAIKKKIALEKAGVKTTINGISLPVDDKIIYEAMKGVDKYLGAVYLPVHFRSTKHFTVNTPLGVTGDYNAVETDRNFIVIDDIDSFINSGYAYSVAYHDAYIDVTHKSLPVSDNAVILIPKDKYDNLIKDEDIKRQLEGRRVVVFNGDEVIAINMILTELGVLPSQIGALYATYDNELKNIISDSIKQLALDNNLLYDKSHAGREGHFSSSFDDKNHDYDRYLNEFIEFLKQKFPEYQSLFTISSVTRSNYADAIVDKIGADRLLAAINEYNTIAIDKFNNRYENYRRDRSNITPEVEEIFKATKGLIQKFYEIGESFDSGLEKDKIEEIIRVFLQGDTVKEQLEAAKVVIDVMTSKMSLSESDEKSIKV